MTTPEPKKIVFLTGTRADFGKLRSLMTRVNKDPKFDTHVFVTGMHMLAKYGHTHVEVDKVGFKNVHKFINQNTSDSMDHVLSKTITGFSDYIREIQPDLVIVHGDRVEALAGAVVGTLNNVLVGHVEGGEVSGTVDEFLRHAVSKMSHIHFVANEQAKSRLVQLGELEGSIYIIGSPDIDIMNSDTLPSLDDARFRYNIPFKEYGIAMFHPVTTEVAKLKAHIETFTEALIKSQKNYVVIYPNNDHGTDIIIEEYGRLKSLPTFRVFPSVRFEHFLTLLRHAQFIIGNSSAGIREAPHFGVPTVNLGTRQRNRSHCESIINAPIRAEDVVQAIYRASASPRTPHMLFGNGGSDEHFFEIVSNPTFWGHNKQKFFVDRPI